MTDAQPKQPRKIVIKLGTSTLTDGTEHLSFPRLFDLVRQIVQIQSQGCQAILVSSGAIAAGREALDFPELPKFIPAKQMLSAVGQPRLMSYYDQFFRMFKVVVSQVLLTRSDIIDRQRYLNARNTIDALTTLNIIPIINENDAVSNDEIRFGDNDALSAYVANLIEADLLVLLTDQEGLFSDDPRRNKDAILIPLVDGPEIPPEIWYAAGGANSKLGTGGMATKITAADLARRSGTEVVIASGRKQDVLPRIIKGDRIGTRLLPIVSHLESRKRYILAGKRSKGILQVDAGAVNALLAGGSLLPVGIVGVDGKFERGDTAVIKTGDGRDIAVGLVNYSSSDIKQILGRKSSEIEQYLGYTLGDEVVHRSNLFLL
jgi:glutamate 5-kinase